MLRDNPEFSTGIGRHDYDDRWTDWSRAGRAQRRERLQRRLKQLDGFAAPPSAQDSLIPMHVSGQQPAIYVVPKRSTGPDFLIQFQIQ